jgi:predicted dehydrogenase
MKNELVKIGLIGVGHFGKFHLNNLIESPFEFIGFYDINREHALAVQEDYNVPYLESVEKLINAVDAVDIVVPTSLHLKYAEMALAKKKHIFIEKPIAADAVSVVDFIKRVNESGIKLQVGHIERYNPAYKALNVTIDPPYTIESKRFAGYNPRANDVSVIHDLMIHDIDAILALVQSPVSSISATGAIVLTDHIDICEARLEFKNGCIANLMSSRLHVEQTRQLELFGNKIYLKVDFLNKSLKKVFIAKDPENEHDHEAVIWDTMKGRFSVVEDQKKFPPSNAILDELNEFYSSIVNDKPTRVDQQDAFQALLIADRIQNLILRSGG